MSYAQNIFTTTSPNETNFVITWTAPYYMTTADVKAEVDKVAWTVVSVSGTNVTLATGIPTDSTVRIYRETDVSSNEVDFLAGSPFRAGDVNLNFDQTLFAIQEALTSDENHEADIDRLEGLIDSILALLNNNIQFVQVANVAALDTVAATDPDNLKGYEVVDSTGLEGANPEIPLLPPKAGTGTGEDPVTGVYWNAGISTKVLWDKANQNWIYVSYFASNGDNRYQQITLQQATAPVLADFKNGTLWFNTTDQNLYVLYDDSGTRSWVLVGPLRDDRYVNRTGDSMTGDLLMNNADVVFEGSTDDGFETTLTVTDPTADNSIVLPDVSGNVVTTGDTGTVTSTMIADGTIVDADINASAAITLTKLGSGALPSNITVNSDNITNLSIVNDDVNANAEIEVSKLANGTARQLLQTDAAGTGVEFTSNVDVPGTLDVTSTAVFDSNVGIGIAAPSTNLHIKGAADCYLTLEAGAADGNTGVLFDNSTGTQKGVIFYDTDDNYMFFSTDNTERVRINGSGNVGIGLSNPLRSLHVAGAGDTGLMLQTTNAVDDNEIWELQVAGNASNHADLIFRTRANAGTGGSEAIRLDSTGRLLVGVSSTAQNNTAVFQGTAQGSSAAGVFLTSTVNNPSSTQVLAKLAFADSGHVDAASIKCARDGGTWTSGSSQPSALTFLTTPSGSASPAERMRISSTGDVDFGPYSESNSGSEGAVIRNSGYTVINRTSDVVALQIRQSGLAKAHIKAGGAATFAGGNIVLNAGGAIQSAGGLYSGFNFSNNTWGCYLQSNGGANFAGGIAYVTSLGSFHGKSIDVTQPASGYTFIGRKADSTATFFVDDGGSATFAGTIDIGGSLDVSSQDAVRISHEGYIQARRSSTGGIFYGYVLNSTSPTTTINADGSAAFSFTACNGGLSTYGISVLGRSTSSNYNFYGNKILNGVETNTSYIRGDGVAVFAGSVQAQGTVLTSDQRFKENITDAKPQLADITALGNKLRNWDWTDDAPVVDKDIRFLGLVAQEAETICPGIVTTIARTKNGAELTPETTDEGGSITPATYEQLDDSYKGIKNDILIMKLLGAVAELSAKVAALEAG